MPRTEEAPFPFSRPWQRGDIVIPLRRDFRFAHEPLLAHASSRFIGREAELDALVQRLLFSEGGSFLITGYRGVGKTSFINQVVAKLDEALPWASSILGDSVVLHVHINLARSLAPAELMHSIIRRLYETLDERGILSQLPGELQRDLMLAHMRTSVNVTRKFGETRERTVGLPGVELGAAPFKVSTKAAFTRKSGLSHQEEMSFLGYDDRAAEHDVIRLSQRLAAGFERSYRWPTRVARWIQRKPRQHRRLRIVFVFDELDKLQDAGDQDVDKPVDRLLNALKMLFTTSGISFVFVAGKDLQERWLEDVGKGDSVYESVFSYDKYLPCMWSDGEKFCNTFVDWAALEARSPCSVGCSLGASNSGPFCNKCGRYLPDTAAALDFLVHFRKYIAYMGRGIPRLVGRCFNQSVRWYAQQPVLQIDRRDARRIRCFAELEDVLQEEGKRLFETMYEAVGVVSRDKRRLSIYYLVDVVLQQGASEFTRADIQLASERLSHKIAPSSLDAAQIIYDLIKLLLKNDFVERVEPAADAGLLTQSQREPDRYRVKPRRLEEIGNRPIDFDEDPAYAPSAPGGATYAGFELLDQVGRGGLATVYRALDTPPAESLAVKVLLPHLVGDASMVQLFNREATLLERVAHPNIVRFRSRGAIDGGPYIAMDFVDGADLARVLSACTTIDEGLAVWLSRQVAAAVGYLHGEGLVRLDVKPANVLIGRRGEVFMIDLGLARRLGHADDEGPPVRAGTAPYVAPEQLTGGPIDARTDIYALGLVLYEMLSGVRPYARERETNLHPRPVREPLPIGTLVQVDPRLEAVVHRCIERNPALRFQTMADLDAALSTLQTDDGAMPRDDPQAQAVALLARIEAGYDRDRDATFLSVANSPTVFDAAPDDEATVVPRPETTTPGGPFLRVVQGPGAVGTVFPLTGKELSIGRSLSNDIALNSVSLSRHQASIRPAGQGYVLVDMNSVNGTYLDDAPVPHYQPVPLLSGQRIRIGEFVLEVDGLPDVVTGARVEVRDGHGVRQVELAYGETLIGRDQAIDVVLDDRQASRRHARIVFEDGNYWIEDLRSINGTMLNGSPVLRERLVDGDHIGIGETVIRFSTAA